MQGTVTTIQPDTERPYPVQDLGPMTGSPEEVFEKALTLVDVFKVLCQKEELELRHDRCGYTDCETFVAANFADPEALLTVEHEISHIFFDSDLKMGTEFRKIVVDELLQQANLAANKKKSPEVEAMIQALEQLVHNVWNALEDHRVRSLWEEIYPGGGYFLEVRWKNVAEHCHKESAVEDLLSYVARTAALEDDSDISAPQMFQNCRPHIIKAKQLVHKTDKKTCLAITKQLILSIADEILDYVKKTNEPINKSPLNPNQGYEENLEKHAVSLGATDPEKGLKGMSQPKQDGLGKVLQLSAACKKSSNSANGSFNAMGDKDIVDAPGAHKRKNRVTGEATREIKRIAKMAGLAAKGDKKAQAEMERLVDKGTREMKRKIREAKAALMGVDPDKDPEEGDKVEYLSAAKCANVPVVVVSNPPPLPKHTKGADRVRQELNRVRMAQKTKLYEEGDDLDVEAFLDAKINGELQNAKLFFDTTSEAGLELLILADCSGSMWPHGIAMVDQAVADIKRAVKNLKVKCHLWAFSNSLYVFPKIGSISGTGGGGTDLVPSLDAAVEWARGSKAQRGIIMLTDGYPTSCRGRNSTGVPKQDMFNVLKEAQKDGIVLSILCIDEKVQEYINCRTPDCNGGLWIPTEESYPCNICGATLTNSGQSSAEYDSWFGKGNYALVKDKKAIAKQLPICARKLVLNHIKRNR